MHQIDIELGRANGQEEYSNVVGYLIGRMLSLGYPTCVKKLCRECKNECKTVQGLKWRQGGKECFKECKAGGGAATVAMPTDEERALALEQLEDGKLGTGTIIAIGAGVLVVLGVVGYAIFKK